MTTCIRPGRRSSGSTSRRWPSPKRSSARDPLAARDRSGRRAAARAAARRAGVMVKAKSGRGDEEQEGGEGRVHDTDASPGPEREGKQPVRYARRNSGPPKGRPARGLSGRLTCWSLPGGRLARGTTVVGLRLPLRVVARSSSRSPRWRVGARRSGAGTVWRVGREPEPRWPARGRPPPAGWRPGPPEPVRPAWPDRAGGRPAQAAGCRGREPGRSGPGRSGHLAGQGRRAAPSPDRAACRRGRAGGSHGRGGVAAIALVVAGRGAGAGRTG